ncbi:hypothetical protein Ddc_21187 [Ditylenchus destructor]|nr:hypothetical protein Ddc_21187 [Ditylenchus destructor]
MLTMAASPAGLRPCNKGAGQNEGKKGTHRKRPPREKMNSCSLPGPTCVKWESEQRDAGGRRLCNKEAGQREGEKMAHRKRPPRERRRPPAPFQNHIAFVARASNVMLGRKNVVKIIESGKVAVDDRWLASVVSTPGARPETGYVPYLYPALQTNSLDQAGYSGGHIDRWLETQRDSHLPQRYTIVCPCFFTGHNSTRHR